MAVVRRLIVVLLQVSWAEVLAGLVCSALPGGLELDGDVKGSHDVSGPHLLDQELQVHGVASAGAV
jgi:hypothetical protein